uniref:hypothetical protein n=2 Tax=Burkholderia vietnamiensis TaxID=60552 RepID=UPI0015931DB4
MKFIIYHHKNLALANYVIECSPTLKDQNARHNVTVVSLPQQHTHVGFAVLPTALRRLLFFARPDVVVCIDDGLRPIQPIFAFELTDHVPAQDHWMQRFNHLVGCAQQGVPGAYVLPFSMRKHPTFPSELDHVFFFAYDRVTEIHETPMFIAEWEVVDEETTKCDHLYASLPDRKSPDLILTFDYLEKVIDYAIHGRSLQDLHRERLIVNLRNRIRRRAYADLPKISDFARLRFNQPDNRPLTNVEFENLLIAKGLALPNDYPERLLKRDKHLVFVPQSDRKGKTDDDLRAALIKRIKDKGGDPYLGQPLAFDYMFCRLGPSTSERDVRACYALSAAETVVGRWKNVDRTRRMFRMTSGA